MSNATDVAALKQDRTDTITILRNQTALWLAAGCPPTFSVDGESYQWESWKKARIEEIKGLTELIAQLSSPWIVRSKGRA